MFNDCFSTKQSPCQCCKPDFSPSEGRLETSRRECYLHRLTLAWIKREAERKQKSNQQTKRQCGTGQGQNCFLTQCISEAFGMSRHKVYCVLFNGYLVFQFMNSSIDLTNPLGANSELASNSSITSTVAIKILVHTFLFTFPITNLG